MAPRQQQRSPEPDPEPDLPEYVDEDHQAISEFAGRYLPEDRREAFIDEFMEGTGHTKVSSWGPRQEPEPDPEPEPEPRRPRQPQRRSGYFR